MNGLMNNGVFMAFLATLLTWGMTAAGAGLVFFFKSIRKGILDGMLGFAAGVMVAASFWSLLTPGISLAEELGQNAVLIAAGGFITGGLFLFSVAMFLPRMHWHRMETKGIKSSFNRSVLLILANILHNVPEGLAIGVAFGAAASTGSGFGGAMALAIGIGLQNFPEGAAVSIPLRLEGLSMKKSFFYGQISGIVEPFAAVLGAILALSIRGILPFALSFAAGAMIFVVVDELIPESQSGGSNWRSDIISIFTMIGFMVMMVLELALN